MIFVKRCPARFAFLLNAPVRRWILQPKRVVNSLKLPARSRILDLGAGSGVMSKALLRWTQSPELVLLDAQPQMIIKAQRRLARIDGPQSMFSVGTAEALPFSNGSFDAVLMVTVLGEVDDIFTTLGEVRRVLAPQGILSVTEHLPDPDFRSVTAVRKLLVKFGFVERDFRGSRWSYTVNATRTE